MTNPQRGVRLPPEAVARENPVPVGKSNIVSPKLPTGAPRMPRCPGCGFQTDATAAWPKGEPCSACAEKPQYQAPQGTIDVAAKPEPAYLRDDYDGNFRRSPGDATGPEV